MKKKTQAFRQSIFLIVVYLIVLGVGIGFGILIMKIGIGISTNSRSDGTSPAVTMTATLGQTPSLASAQRTATATTTMVPTEEDATSTPSNLLPGMSKGDLHLHTTCSDGRDSYEEMVQAALTHNYTFIAITDHIWCPFTVYLCRNETRLICIPGLEVRMPGINDVIALNLQAGMTAKPTMVELVNAIHAEGGVAIAAHPFLPGYEYQKDTLLSSGFDAMECNVWGSAAPGFDINTMRCVWSSDAHAADTMGLPFTYTVCDVLIHDFDELKDAILGGYCHPGY